MKSVYRADAVTHYFVSSDVVADDYKLQANESFDSPSGLQAPRKLTTTGWIAATDEEHKAWLEAYQKDWLAQHPQAAQPSRPADDKGDQALNLLGQQLAQVEAQQATLTKSVNALGQMVAKAQAPKQA